jgi:hypothetical protein
MALAGIRNVAGEMGMKIELYRPSGTQAFALRGFTFYGEVL